MKAIRLLNDNHGNSYFQSGELPEYHKIEEEDFKIQTESKSHSSDSQYFCHSEGITPVAHTIHSAKQSIRYSLNILFFSECDSYGMTKRIKKNHTEITRTTFVIP